MANSKKNKKNNEKKMHGRKVSAWTTVFTVAVALLIALAASVYIFLETYVPDVDDVPHFAELDYKNGFSLTHNTGMYKYNISRALTRFGSAVSTQIKNLPSKEIKREEGVYNFLVLGHDKVALNTDVIMVVNFDVNDGSINIMQLPRDTYIEHGAYSHKINSMLAYLVNEARYAGDGNVYYTALTRYSEILEGAFGIEIDNYALVNLDAFSSIVDIVGGVPIDVPEAMHYDDEFQDLSIHIEAGPQVLDGKTAMGFVRFRSGYLQADIGRLNAQKLFMTAFLKRVKETISVNTVAKIAEQVLKNVTTDLSLNDAVYYAKSALSVDLGNMNMMTLPGEAVNSGLSYYVIYRNSTLELINEYFNVYSADITDEMFDRELLFTDGKSTKIDSVYRRVDGEYVVNNGESVDEAGIYIPRYYGEPDVDDDEPVVTAVSTQADTADTSDTAQATYDGTVSGTDAETDTSDSADESEDETESDADADDITDVLDDTEADTSLDTSAETELDASDEEETLTDEETVSADTSVSEDEISVQ